MVSDDNNVATEVQTATESQSETANPGSAKAANHNGNSLPPTASAQLSAAEAATGGNIDKIREIIFGNQMRDYEKRFARLEERLLKDSADLRDDMRRRLEQLEAFVQSEVEALSDQLRNEQNDRAGADSDLTRELRDLTRNYEKKVSQLDDQIVKGQRDLRQQLNDQARNLSDEIRQKIDDLAATLDREADELRTEKTDRAALASLFTEMAMRLNDEFSLPNGA